MFTSNGTKRRRLISFINRNLERILAVNTPADGRVDSDTYNVTIDTTEENPLFETDSDQELDAIIEEQKQRRVQKLLVLLNTIPRGIARRLIPRETINNIREALHGLRIDQLPAAIINQLNEIL